MISTPAAPDHHPHKLSPSGHSQSFRDHLVIRRHPAQHSMQPLPPTLRESVFDKTPPPGFERDVYPGQNFLSTSFAQKTGGQQLDVPTTEHMLRRKTPNGTLKAGYDGTPVDWASGPPAHKQHAIRNGLRDDNADNGFRRQACILLSDSAAQQQVYATIPTPIQQDNYNLFDSSYEANKRQLLHRTGPGPQMDSLLYQAAPQPQLLHNGNGYAQIPYAMQATWPRNIEPTASGPPMQYGPYWGNGALETYRPPAARDGRFDSQFSRINLNEPVEPQPWPRAEVPRDRLPMRNCFYLGPANRPGVRLDHQSPYPQQLQHQLPQLLQRSVQTGWVPDQRLMSDETTSHGNTALYNHTTFSESTSTSPNYNNDISPPQQLQFKEMAFVQGHRTYMTLLAQLQQARKQMQQNKQPSKHMPNLNLYPKAPRFSYSLDGSVRSMAAVDVRAPARNAYSSLGPISSFGTGMTNIHQEATSALDLLRQLAVESNWTWTEGILLAGCLAYGLNNPIDAQTMFRKVLDREPQNVEALSNLAAVNMTINRRDEAEAQWAKVVEIRPGHFESVEHLVGLLCVAQRSHDAIRVINHVQTKLAVKQPTDNTALQMKQTYKLNDYPHHLGIHFGSTNLLPHSGYGCQPVENGRLIALIHAKGNMLYATGQILDAADAFEEAIMIAVGKTVDGISGLIRRILGAFSQEIYRFRTEGEPPSPWETILLLPQTAVRTKELTFPNSKPLPGLDDVPEGQPKRAAIAVTSNCLLSLAKIYQDSMSSGGTALGPSGATGVQDILALYYLSLSLQPSPSTANNVGILLAGVQQSASSRLPAHLIDTEPHMYPGVVPGTGVALALAYYKYGLVLDDKHAHLYTNLGSLLKDLGQLDHAILMYEKAVQCDGKFDIALANLANAVKDRGRISDAIGYYQRAVDANPDFAEAVCGLANALNSVCGWTGRGGMVFSTKRFDRWHVNDEGMLVDSKHSTNPCAGWIGRVVAIVVKQLAEGRGWGKNLLTNIDMKALAHNSAVRDQTQAQHFLSLFNSWQGHDYEGAKVVRFVERATRQISWKWYQDRYVHGTEGPIDQYLRPQLPGALTVPNAPTVLPFHTFTCPLTATQIRQISQRNGLRISASTLKAPWLPAHVFNPPRPPRPHLNVGYVSSDFNNHPLAHLMQSVFGMHNRAEVRAFCYATTPSDKSIHRQKIELEAPTFYDASTWPVDRLVKQIVNDEIHILVNLNGYTRGARNEVFAARPAPIQMSFMGFAGTLGAEWCDYLLADETAVPTSTLRPHRDNVSLLDVTEDDNFSDRHDDWVYGENIVYTRDTFFCCDHRQSAPDAQEVQLTWPNELARRRAMRKELFPQLADNVVILGNFNQLYKIEPTTFRTWLRVLQAVPNAVMWLLRFPDLGEQNLRAMAEKWSSPDVSKRIIFTDVAPKHQHIARARICDLFLDTPECNAHTTSADVLWSGTPLLTYPRYDFKMCSRMAASILKGAMPHGQAGRDAAKDLIVQDDDAYEAKAVELASGLADVLAGRRSTCRALEIRKLIYEGRWSSPLFDTQRWTRDLETAYRVAWDKWVAGEGGDIWL